MKLLSTALLAAGMLALSACGGAVENEAAADNSVDALAVPADDLLAPVDNSLTEVPADSLGNEADALDAGNAVVDANVQANSQ